MSRKFRIKKLRTPFHRTKRGKTMRWDINPLRWDINPLILKEVENRKILEHKKMLQNTKDIEETLNRIRNTSRETIYILGIKNGKTLEQKEIAKKVQKLKRIIKNNLIMSNFQKNSIIEDINKIFAKSTKNGIDFQKEASNLEYHRNDGEDKSG